MREENTAKKGQQGVHDQSMTAENSSVMKDKTDQEHEEQHRSLFHE